MEDLGSPDAAFGRSGRVGAFGPAQPLVARWDGWPALGDAALEFREGGPEPDLKKQR